MLSSIDTMNVGLLVIILVFSIPIVAIIGGTLISIIKLLTRDRNGRMSAEETRMVQEIYKGLEKMEKRVEALETLLVDRDRKDRT